MAIEERDGRWFYIDEDGREVSYAARSGALARQRAVEAQADRRAVYWVKVFADALAVMSEQELFEAFAGSSQAIAEWAANIVVRNIDP